MWTVICLTLALVFIGIQVLSLLTISRASSSTEDLTDWPRVSILLAARNEEKLIERSLKHLAKLDYPTDRLEVLIGDDASEDRTSALVQAFIQDKPHFKLFSISKTLGEGRGKANVLAHLAHEAQGSIFLITDVDVAVSEQWAKALVAQFTAEVGIVSGTTTCTPSSVSSWVNLQSMDWLHFMGYIQSFAELGVGCTSVGNNMAVRAEAYWQTGGYEVMPFSITEDYRLFQHVTANGWEWRSLCNKDVLGLAWPIESFRELLHQRKRWLIGAKDLTVFWKSLLVLYGLFVPIVVVLLSFNWQLALAVWALKFALQSAYIRKLHRQVDLTLPRPHRFVWYEAYVLFLTLLSALFFFAPVDSQWKGRRYNSKGLN